MKFSFWLSTSLVLTTTIAKPTWSQISSEDKVILLGSTIANKSYLAIITPSKSEQHEERYLALEPNDAYAYFNRGNIYFDQGKLELAIADYNQAIAINPNHAEVYSNRGAAYSRQGKLELAVADFNQAIKLNSNYTNRGTLYKQKGKLELAVADFNQAILLDSNLAEAYGNRGLIYMQMGNSKAARSNLQRAKELFVSQGNIPGANKTNKLLNNYLNYLAVPTP
ncbi:MAG TPA: tetratricopeptide repeat protein [Coleofasciculaceae cyanobacterium]|jgi:tetratricopeptide (TPR) repeat protein